MEFSYQISEKEFLRARQLQAKRGFHFDPFKIVLFWLFIMVCLMLLWGIVQRTASKPSTQSEASSASRIDNPSSSTAALATSGDSALSEAATWGAFIVTVGLPIFLKVVLPRIRVRRMYRNDPQMQGHFTVKITPTSISTHNTSGASSQSGWNIYEYWREGRDLIVLVFRSGTYFIMSLAGLSEPQRQELRGILTSALPKK